MGTSSSEDEEDADVGEEDMEGLALGAGALNSSSVVAGEKQVRQGWQVALVALLLLSQHEPRTFTIVDKMSSWPNRRQQLAKGKVSQRVREMYLFHAHTAKQCSLWESETGKRTTVTRIPAFTAPKSRRICSGHRETM